VTRPFIVPLIALIAGTPMFVAPGTSVAAWAYTLAFTLFVVLSWLGAHRRTGRARLAHGLVAASLTMWLFGDLLYAFLIWRYQDSGDVSAADFMWIAGYPLLAAGLIQMVRLRAPGRLREAALDGLAMVIVVATLFWTFMMRPLFTEAGMSAADVLEVAYPFGDVLLFAAGALLVLSPGGRRGAIRYLTVALAVTFVADVSMSLAPIWYPDFDFERLDGVLLLANSLFAAALWHPDAGQLTDPRTVEKSRLHPARVVFLAISLVALPALADLRISDVVLGRGSIMIAMALLTAIVLTRFMLVVRAQEKIREVLAHRATHDTLTGLVNRQELHARLTAALASRADDDGDGPVVHFLDLNGFKPINDRYGHAAGDYVLQEIARRLRGTVRHAETVARLGGDEFVVVTASTGDAAAMTERLRRAVTAPIRHEEHRLTVDVSIGVATPAGLSRPTSDALLAAADAGMYREKSAGRAPVPDGPSLVNNVIAG
jgi:diguanylate cyclase (GGDEF)-like protein